MELLSLDCPRCGAHLPPTDPVGTIQCGYCGATFQAPQARAARTMAGQAVDPQQLAKMIAAELAAQQRPAAPPSMPPPSPYAAGPVTVHHRASGRGWLVFVMVALGTCVPVGVGLVNSGVLGDVPGMGQLAEATQRLLYDTAAGPPVPATIGGKPAFVARTRVVYPEDELFIDAYDAQTLERLWRVGPLGTYSEGYQSTLFGVADDKVVISHADSTVSIHDLNTGEQLSAHALTDKVQQICVSPPTEKTKGVFLQKVDEKHIHLLLEGSELKEVDEVPDWCPDRWRDRDAMRPDFAPVKDAPEVEGFKTEHAHVQGELAVAAGVKHPGSAIPLLVGYDPKSKEVRWQTEAYAVDRSSVRDRSMEHGALSGDRFFTVYGSGTDAWHVTGFDARTGDRLWHTDLRPIFAVDSINDVRATDTHVFVVRTSSMEVYDATSGTLLGTVGYETYD